MRDRRAADDDERAVRPRGDACGAQAAARGAGGRRGHPAPDRAAAMAMHQRAIRRTDARGRDASASPKDSRTSRSATSFSKTCGNTARRSLRAPGLTPLFPIWGIPTDELASRMVDGGLRSVLTCVNPKHLDRSFAGRQFDRSLLADLPAWRRPVRRARRVPLVRLGRTDVQSSRVDRGRRDRRSGRVRLRRHILSASSA